MSATSGSLGQLAIVDAHIHLWDLQALSYPWLTTRYDHGAPFAPYHAICRNYLIPDLQQDAANLRLTKAVHINAAVGHPDPVEETAWVQGQADTHGFTLGIIAGMDLRAHTCAAELDLAPILATGWEGACGRAGRGRVCRYAGTAPAGAHSANASISRLR